MAEQAAGTGGGTSHRRALWRRYVLLRDPRGRAACLTPRAGRFAARQTGCSMDLGRLAALPLCDLDPELDRDALAQAAGLLAARGRLLRTIDGALLRQLAGHFGEELIDGVLDASDLPAPGDDVPLGAMGPAQLRAAGFRLIDQAARPERPEARAICERAGQLIAMRAPARAPAAVS